MTRPFPFLYLVTENSNDCFPTEGIHVMKYNRTIEELESRAIHWWPQHLHDANAKISIIPKLLETQDDFLRIISLSKDNPYHLFEILKASKFPGSSGFCCSYNNRP